MQLGLISRSGEDASTRALTQVAEARRHQVVLLDPREVVVSLRNGTLTLASAVPALSGEPGWHGVDVLIHRYNHQRDVEHAGRVADAVAFTRGIPLINPGEAVTRASSKSQLAELLTRAGVQQLPTYLLAGGGDPDLLASTVGLPVVVKQDRGAQGVGVYRADTVEQLEALLHRFADTGPLLAQPWEPYGSAVTTALVVDREVVAVVTRTAPDGLWLATTSFGGRLVADAVADDEHLAATAAAAAARLDLAAVELVRCPDGPVVLDVNPGPSLAEMVAVTGPGCLHAIVDAAERRVVAD